MRTLSNRLKAADEIRAAFKEIQNRNGAIVRLIDDYEKAKE